MSTDNHPPLTLEQRVLVLEWLLDSALWGPHLHDPEHLRHVAAHLYGRLEAAQRTQAIPAAVLHELNRRADAMAGLDTMPTALLPAIRRVVLPPDPPAGNPDNQK